MTRLRATFVGTLLVALLFLTACGDKPERPAPPPYEPMVMGEAAVEQFDENEDSILDAKEITNCPSLVKAIDRIDANGDGEISREELTQRVETLLEGPHILPCNPRILIDGEPLVGATVTLEPEKFLGRDIGSFSGVTNESGDAYLSGPQEGRNGIYPGFYVVRISKIVDGQETIPARYNVSTVLGHEEAEDIPGLGLPVFELTSGN